MRRAGDRRKIPTILRDLAFVGVVAGSVVFLLVRTSETEPYARIEIVGDRLAQHPIEAEGQQWGLFYAILAVKPKSCDEVKMEQQIERRGEPLPIVATSYVGDEIFPQSSMPVLVTGLHVPMGATPLEPGEYLFALKTTCYLDSDGVGLRALAPSAEAYVCFRVPDVSNIPYLEQRIQPITEECQRAARTDVMLAETTLAAVR